MQPYKGTKVKKMIKNDSLFVSMETVRVGSWFVKASNCSTGGILIVLFNNNTLQSFTKYFDDEIQANLFLTRVIDSVNQAGSSYQ